MPIEFFFVLVGFIVGAALGYRFVGNNIGTIFMPVLTGTAGGFLGSVIASLF